MLCRKVNTKWVDFNVGSVIFDFGKAISVEGTYSWATGNNRADRDPVQWTLEAWSKGWKIVDDHTHANVHVPQQREEFLVAIPLGVAAQFETILGRHAICSGAGNANAFSQGPGPRVGPPPLRPLADSRSHSGRSMRCMHSCCKYAQSQMHPRACAAAVKTLFNYDPCCYAQAGAGNHHANTLYLAKRLCTCMTCSCRRSLR